ncbi:hypothetical protein [Solidesulfovibrio magneticus]|uniref:hypothetical protein n=1 Tax=Solidesulfovibrio magneticus TaxID=184917 RepID=UPI0005BBE2E7|nr:hypothetical protein [Solidesulfovibrio magneticus]
MPWIDSSRLAWKRLCVGGMACLLLGIALAAYGWRPSRIWRTADCLMTRHAALWPHHRFEGFFKTTTVEQAVAIQAMENCELRLGDDQIPYVTPRDPGKLALLHVRIRKDFDEYVFFPRVSKNSEVLVCEDNILNVLFRLKGEEDWTPIGRRYLLDLSCCEHGEEPRQFSVNLVIVLRGPWAQVWLPGEKAFFR